LDELQLFETEEANKNVVASKDSPKEFEKLDFGTILGETNHRQ